MPPAGWTPPERLVVSQATGTAVRFIEQSGRRERIFHFDDVALRPGVREWLALVFAAAVGPRSTVTRQSTAEVVFSDLKQFAWFLERSAADLRGPEGLGAWHVKAYRLSLSPEKSRRRLLKSLRKCLREFPGLPEGFRSELFDVPLARQLPAEPSVSYTDDEIQQIMTVLRSDIRRARDRIGRARAVLAAYRRGELDPQSPDGRLGPLLDFYDLHGDLRGLPQDKQSRLLLASAGGVPALMPMLCLTSKEAVSFGLLLAVLTGENYSTVADWPAVATRPDGGVSGPAVGLVEAVKGRRGPDLEHMVTPLEDLPPVLAGVLAGADDDMRLFRSPLRIYLLLLDMSEMVRRHGGSDRAFGCVTARKPGWWTIGLSRGSLARWVTAHGFPTEDQAEGDPGGKPAVNVRRIRQSVVEGGHRPIAHTRRTRDDHYLKCSHIVQADSRIVVGDALRQEVTKARDRQGMRLLPLVAVPEDGEALAAAASSADLAPGLLAAVVAGRRDTVAAACTDPDTGPDAPAGRACGASFFDCFDCDNARALPRHLPVQIELRGQLAALRPNLDPQTWQVRFDRRVRQLDDVIGHYTAAEQDKARTELTGHQHQLVDDLINGRLDLL